MRTACLLALLALIVPLLRPAHAQGTVPTFKRALGESSYTLAGRDPAQSGTTVIPTVLVPITLTFEGKPVRMDASLDVPLILGSPIFTKFGFASGASSASTSSAEKMQYADALLHSTFPADKDGHTVLGKPEVKAVTIAIPVGYGYLLKSKKSGLSFAVVDSEFVEKELFRKIPRQDGKLVIAVTHNTSYYALGDATVCCTWGTHGIDAASGNSFVLGSYLRGAPAIVEDRDVQPLTQQLAEFVNDPLHDPQTYFRTATAAGNYFPAWLIPGQDRGCGGAGVGSNYFLLEPTNTNPKNSFPASPAFVARAAGFTYHLQNVALLPWYLGAAASSGGVYSFPDPHALAEPAKPCPDRNTRMANGAPPTVAPVPSSGEPNGHQLIGYWTGSGFNLSTPFPMHEVAPQWDVIIAAFASPDKTAPEGTLRFRVPRGIDPDQLKSDIAALKSQHKKVMISLGGGGEYFTLNDPKNIRNFVSSVTSVVSEYGFDGVDIDFESPSLVIAPGDADYKHPTTPSIVNLIAGLRELREHFGPGFMISLVPEGTQIPGGYASYGGQFGSYLPIAYALRDILSFIDVQDYNTPPLEGLDGEIYQSSSIDYHAAMTELLLHGFDVGGDPRQFFSPFPPDKIAVGFLTGYTTPTLVSEAVDYITTGRAPAGSIYKLRRPSGYPAMIGAMFWTIDDDRRGDYKYSNLIGPQLHRYPKN
jgi:chitinase